MKYRYWLLLAVMAAGLAQNEAPIARERNEWVQTVSGSVALKGAERLRISTRGAIAVRGESRGDIAYTAKKRVRAGSEADARRLLERANLASRHDGNTLILSLNAAAIMADLSLRVPQGMAAVALESAGGPVEAAGLEGAIAANTGGGPIQADRIKGDANLKTGGGPVRLGALSGTVRCVSGGGSITADTLGREARLTTGGGDISVREAGGPVHANTGGGNIRIERASARVEASTGGGLIEVVRGDGPVNAETGGGKIKVAVARGVRCQSGAGPIELREVSGGLRAATGAGSIIAELASGPFEDSALATNGGDITVFIPSNLAVTVQAIAELARAARIVSDFPEIRVRQEGPRGPEAQGALNGGGPLLKLTVSGGSIYLRRR